MPLVTLEGVGKSFGRNRVPSDVNLSAEAGEVVCVIGPSGSGKSTLRRCINRLETIDEGLITFDGKPLPQEGRELAGLRAQVGMVFQSFNLFAHRTVLDNVTLGPRKVLGLNGPRPRSGPARCWNGWASRTRRTGCPGSFPAGSSSGPR